MSTIGYENWAVDIGAIGAIYPMQGAELVMAIIGVVAWLGWHVLQFSAEKRELEEESQAADADAVKRRIEDY